MEKKYYPELDVVKGIAILMVIMGHSFCSHPIDLGAQLPTALQQIISCCQMPLFFVASGFLFSPKGTWADFFRKKGMRLLVPYVTFSILTISLRYAFAPFTNSGAPNLASSVLSVLTGGFYWFLYVLFIIMVVCKLVVKDVAIAAIGVVSLIASLLVSDVPPIVSRLILYPFFFVGGISLRKYYHRILDKLSVPVTLTYAVISSVGYGVLNGGGILKK